MGLKTWVGLKSRRVASSAAIVVCVKNEGRYLIEWIAWHRLCGFDEIVIYDNESTDGTQALLRPLADAGEIVLLQVADRPDRSPQSVAYRAEIVRPTKTRWVMFADADEFLVIANGETIGEFLQRFPPGIAQICFNWRLFGSAGLSDYEPRPVVERFTRASQPTHPINRHVKAISKRSRITAVSIHAPFLSSGPCLHDDGEPCTMKPHGIAGRISYQHAWINHYLTKSRGEFDTKIARGRGAVPAGAPHKTRPNPEAFWSSHDRNETECLVAKARLPELLAEMKRLEGIRERASTGNGGSTPQEKTFA